MAIRGLLFDFDGLILDTEGPSLTAWQEVYAKHASELSLEEWSAAIGTMDGFDAFAHLEGLLQRPLDRDAIEAARFRRKLELLVAEQVRPGVVDYLERALELGLQVAVVSSSPSSWVDEHLIRLGLRDRWHSLHCADGDPSVAKPAPTLYLAALAALGLPAAEAIAIEDSPNGIRAAKRARLFCVAVPNRVTALLDLSEADVVVESLSQLPLDALLERAVATGNRSSAETS